jgi:hypothetical protein
MMSSSSNGHIPHQGPDHLGTTSVIKNSSPPPPPQSRKEDPSDSGSSHPMEMTPMLQIDQHSNHSTTNANGSISSKYSPNISTKSKESSPCQTHCIANETSKSNVQNGNIKPEEKNLKCDSKHNSALYCSQLTTPTVKCVKLKSELDDASGENSTKMSTIHYKVLTMFMGSCVVVLLCLILIMFLNPQLFFKSKGKKNVQN